MALTVFLNGSRRQIILKLINVAVPRILPGTVFRAIPATSPTNNIAIG
jgi:hypothetical protein